jgi:hypothetical protein
VRPIVLQFSYRVVASGSCERSSNISNGQEQDCVVGLEAKREGETGLVTGSLINIKRKVRDFSRLRNVNYSKTPTYA